MTPDEFLHDVILRALEEVRHHKVAIFTMALGMTMEGRGVAVYVDTVVNSDAEVLKDNMHRIRYFEDALRRGNLADMKDWQANHGRNLSLADFAMVGLAETQIPAGISIGRTPRLRVMKLSSALARCRKEIAVHAERVNPMLAVADLNEDVEVVWPLDVK
jgi:hypothetical protein